MSEDSFELVRMKMDRQYEVLMSGLRFMLAWNVLISVLLVAMVFYR
jgi:hypothetical protein